MPHVPLTAGVHVVDISPSTPQWLDGYGTRTAPSEGAYLPLTARALLLRRGDAAALLLSAEVLGFDRARVHALKARLAAAAGVPVESVILAATHTHCAPRVCDMVMPGAVDPDYLDWFEERCVDAAAGAARLLHPVRLSVSRGRDPLGMNRRWWTGEQTIMLPNPQGPHDRDVDTMWLEDAETGAVRASLTVMACHPTCRGERLTGGDYPGYLMRELERAVGGVALYVLGCAGDVRPHFTNEEGRFRPASPEEVEAAGCGVAEEVLAASRTAVDAEGLEVRRTVVEIPLAAPPSRDEWERIAADEGELPLRRLWARGMLERGDTLPRSIPFEIQAVLLKPGLTLVFWPGEVAADYALSAKEEWENAGHRLLVGAYANGAVGYVPSARMIPFGGYEVDGSHIYYNLPAPYAPEVEQLLLTATRRLLDRQS